MLTRALMRWSNFRKCMKTLDEMANGIAGLSNGKKTRNRLKKIRRKNIPESTKAEMIKQLRENINSRKRKRVVFFGDGQFSSGGHGHASVPRKALIRHISCRTVCVITSEFGTSKYCPGCGSTMKDVEGEIRTRSCTNFSREDSTACCLREDETAFLTDRDECGAMGIALCGGRPLLGFARPSQYEARLPMKQSVERRQISQKRKINFLRQHEHVNPLTTSSSPQE